MNVQLATRPGQAAGSAPPETWHLEGRPHCVIEMTSAGTGVYPLLTGLEWLARSNVITLECRLRPKSPLVAAGPWHLRDKRHFLVNLRVARGGSAIIDLHDGGEIDHEALALHDLYFKRSFDPQSMIVPGGWKLRPLGLVTEIRDSRLSGFELRRELAEAGGVTARLKRLATLSVAVLASPCGVGSRATWARLHVPPNRRSAEPGVVAMAGLWDPDELPARQRLKRLEWESLNRQRVGCIRALRRAFGALAYVGVRPSAFARRYCPDVVLPTHRSGSFQAFLHRLRSHPVVVTSTGLHGSNGYRLAEGVAMARAVVTEPLRYEVPGEFAPHSHYLQYTTPQECVDRVAWLFDRPDDRREMMYRNWQYSSRWLRPDRVAARLVALTQSAGDGGR
jgi:hypothetical protein